MSISATDCTTLMVLIGELGVLLSFFKAPKMHSSEWIERAAIMARLAEIEAELKRGGYIAENKHSIKPQTMSRGQTGLRMPTMVPDDILL